MRGVTSRVFPCVGGRQAARRGDITTGPRAQAWDITTHVVGMHDVMEFSIATTGCQTKSIMQQTSTTNDWLMWAQLL